MAGNKIYRGRADMQPHTVHALVDGALKPGTVCVYDGTDMAAAGADAEGRLYILNNLPHSDQSVTDAYADNDSCAAYRLRPDDEFCAIAAAASYTQDQELTTNASGQLVAAASGNIVVAFADEAVTLGAAGLLDVVIANSYIKS